MSVDGILLYRSHVSVSEVESSYQIFVGQASELDAKSLWHYDAIPGSYKHLESHMCICECSVPREDHTDDADQAEPKYSSPQNQEEIGAPSPDGSFSEDKGHSSSDHLESPSAEEDLSRQGNNLIAWTDDDVDATDYKNMPDYDPDQEESEYDSTPSPQPIATAPSARVGFSMTEVITQRYIKLMGIRNSSLGPKSRKRDSPHSCSLHLLSYFIQRSCLEHPIQLASGLTKYCNLSVSTPKRLLLLFIPGPLQTVDQPLYPIPTTTAISPKHSNFISHFERYPYLTSHDNYLKHTAYVLGPDSPGAKPHYLIVQEFSELESLRGHRMGAHWELKRKEAKHWWRKEDRGARGVKAGFYRLVQVGRIGPDTEVLDSQKCYRKGLTTSEIPRTADPFSKTCTTYQPSPHFAQSPHAISLFSFRSLPHLPLAATIPSHYHGGAEAMEIFSLSRH